MWRTTLRTTWRSRRRLAATGLAVLLGVAFLACTLVLGDAMRAGFREAFAGTSADVDVVLRPDRTAGDHGAAVVTLPVGLLDELGATEGVAAAAGEVVGLAQLSDADGVAIGGGGPPTLGIAWVEDEQLRPFELLEGAAPDGPSEVAIDADTAAEAGLDVGAGTTVRTPTPREVTIVGLLEPLGGPAAGVTVTAFAPAVAGEVLLGDAGRLSSITVRAEPGTSPAELVERLTPLLPDGTSAVTGDQAAEEAMADVDEVLTALSTFLLAFAGIALVVAAFSIANTFTITVAQRRRETAMLRTIGASRRQVLGATLLEASIIGVVASVLGLLVGVALALGLQELLATVGFDLGRTQLVLTPTTVAVALLVGTGVTLVAATLPALRASRTSPLAALRDVAAARTDPTRVRTGVGAMATTVGTILAVTAPLVPDRALLQVAFAALLVLVGVLLLGPAIARPAAAVLGGFIARTRGVPGTLAQRNVARDPRRTANTATALLLGVAVVTAVTTLAASISTTVEDTVAGAFAGDLVVSAAGFSGAGLDPAIVDELAALPEVAAVGGIGLGAAEVDGEERVFSVADLGGLSRLLDVDVVAGSLAAVDADTIAVAATAADEAGWQVGSSVTFDFPDGSSTDVEVGLVYEGGAGDALGTLVVAPELWEARAARSSVTTVLLDLAAGVTADDGRDAVTTVTDRHGRPDLQTAQEFADAATGDVDQLLGVVYALLALTVIIALVGIANTLSLAVHERTSEIGLVRALGLTRRQLRAVIRWESVVTALIGTVTGALLGGALAWAFVRALAAQEGLGTFTAPAGQLAVVVALGAVVGVVAAVRPARRAARTDVLVAIATE